VSRHKVCFTYFIDDALIQANCSYWYTI